ncbi:4'-phosphopantetheinyl transferase family protein [Rhodoblastus sp.]|uniref:4'-phosphopantetheinyl transferase family protein n=1 Tax=Rhodoblastus sp. TaxID=1962975 RepID=UPI003F94C9C8
MTFPAPDGPILTFAARHDIELGARAIAPGDEGRLWPEEGQALAAFGDERKRASGAARALARDLLAKFGAPPCAIGRDREGVPLWPPGFVGSLAHDETHVLVAVAGSEKVAALGVDLEPDAPLAPGLAELVATPAERARYDEALLRRPILFVVKEAVFKALFPADRRFLDFHDIEADLETGSACAKFGGRCAFAWESGAKIIALAARDAQE